MTKLEELKAAWVTYRAARGAAWDDARDAAWVAYRDELKKTQKENTDENR